MITEILFAAIPKPDPEHLGNLLLLFFSEPIVELQSPLAFHATGAVLVSIPVGAGESDAPVRLLHQGRAGEFVIRGFLLFAHVIVAKTPVVVGGGL